MELMNENGDWARLDSVLLQARLADGRQVRRSEAGERRRQNVAARRAQTELQRAEAADRRHIRQTKKAMRELGLLAPIRAFGPRMRVRAELREPVFSAESPNVARRQARPVPIVRKLTTGRRVIIDLKGRESVFIKFTYLGLKSNGWAPGKAAAHARYVHEHDRQWGLFPLSNMGQSIDEIAACWDAIEAIEQEYRANAKIQLRAVGYLPTDLSFEQMRQVVQAIGEREFGALSLPWSAAVHPPRPGQNNWHFHIDTSMRPFARVGENDWVFASEKINGIDNPAGLKELRGRMCGHLNHALCKAKSTRRYTHLTFSERGIEGARRQQHLGPERAAAAEKGEHVAMAVRNAEQAEVNWAADQRYLAAAQLQAADLDLRKARLKVETAVAHTTLATIRDTVTAANRLTKVSHFERMITSVEPLCQYVDNARCIERIAANMVSIPPIDLDGLGQAISHAKRCERLGLEMAHGATSTWTAAVDDLATSIAFARKLVGIEVRSDEPSTADLHHALADVRALQAINIISSPTDREMTRNYRLMAEKLRAQETTRMSSVDGSCGVPPTYSAPQDMGDVANVPPALEVSAPVGAGVSQYEMAACAELGTAQRPTRNALINATNAFIKWGRDDSELFIQRFMIWRDAMSVSPLVRAWNEAWDNASNVASDDDVRSRAKALLQDEESMARIRTQAPLLEIAVRLCMPGDPEQFEPQLGLNSYQRGSPTLAPSPAVAMPSPSQLANDGERRQSRAGVAPPPPPVSGQRPPLNSPDPMKQIWARDRSNASSASPDIERISDMYKNVPVKAPMSLQVSVSAPPSVTPAQVPKQEAASSGDDGRVGRVGNPAAIATSKPPANLPSPVLPVRDLRWAAEQVRFGLALAFMDRDGFHIIPFDRDEAHLVEVPTGLQHIAEKLVARTRLRVEAVNEACEIGAVVVGTGGRLASTIDNHHHLLEFAQRMYDEPELRSILQPHIRRAAENAAFAEERRRREEAEKAALQPPQSPLIPSPSIPPPAPARHRGRRKNGKGRYRRKGLYVPDRGGSPEMN